MGLPACVEYARESMLRSIVGVVCSCGCAGSDCLLELQDAGYICVLS